MNAAALLLIGLGATACGRVAFDEHAAGDAAVVDAAPWQVPSVRWARPISGLGAQEGFGIALAPSGRVVLAGRSEAGTIDFGAGPLAGGGLRDLFVASYTEEGALDWALSSRGAGDERAWDLAVDRAGNIYVAGSFNGELDLGAGIVTSQGDFDGFVASWTADGSLRWVRLVTGPLIEQAFGIAVGLDAADQERVYVTGWFTATSLVFGQSATSAGGQDGFVAELDLDGGTRAVSTFGGATTDQGQKVAVGPAGVVHAAGVFSSQPAMFGATAMTSAGDHDAFVARLVGGALTNVRRLGGTLRDHGNAVSHSGGLTVLGGLFSDVLTMSGLDLASAGGEDGFVAAYDDAGDVRWARQFGSSADVLINGLAEGPDGFTGVCGRFGGVADLAGVTRASQGSTDAFLTVLDHDGENLWTESIGSTSGDTCFDLALGPDRAIVALVVISSAATIGGEPFTPTASDTILVRWRP